MTTPLQPQTAEELAALIRDASAAGQPLVPWGAGTLQHFGNPPVDSAERLHASGLNRIVEYVPGDLTITLESGVTLGAVQDVLRPHSQWLPWVPPAPKAATIGGLLATGVSGPLRLGYGTPRDWVLGMQFVLGDGRLVKSGGKVVKNVAGYESHKLHIGALGTLGVIVSATLKIAPLPDVVETRVFACVDRVAAVELAQRLREPPLAPVSLLLANDEANSTRVVVRFAGARAAVERQVRAAEQAASRAAQSAIGDANATTLWEDLARFSIPSAAEKLMLRIGAPPAALATALDLLEQHSPDAQPTRWVAYAGVGLIYARWDIAGLEMVVVANALAELRTSLAKLGGYAVIECAPPRTALDRWGAPPPTFALMRALKAQWDPQGILNRGRLFDGLDHAV